MTATDATTAARAPFALAFALACAVVAVESASYASVTPLVPVLHDELGLTPGGAGVLVAAYPAGMLLGSLPGGWLTSRFGSRAGVALGLALFVVACAWFGLSHTVLALELSRLVQGVGGSLCWCGALAWVASVAPAGRQASALGGTVGMAVVGVLLGPAIGGVAAEVGRAPVFLAAAAVAAVLVPPVLLLAPAARSAMPVAAMLEELRGGAAAAAIWTTGVTGVVIGAASVLAPLRLDGLGAGPLAVAAVFVGGGVLEAAANPLAGLAADRRGARRPMTVALCLTAGLLVLLAAVDARAAVIAGIVLLLPSAGMLLTPCMAVLGRVAEQRMLPAAAAFTAGNVAWAIGESAGAFGGPWLTQRTAAALPYLAMAALCAGTAVALRRRARDL